MPKGYPKTEEGRERQRQSGRNFRALQNRIKLQFGNLGGRPSTYRPEYCDRLRQAASEGYSLTAFAGILGTCREVLYGWGQRFPEFAVAIKDAKALRLAKWEALALGLVNSTERVSGGQTAMCIFGLKNCDPEEWRDKTVVEHDISDRVADRLEKARLRMLGELTVPAIEGEIATPSD